MSAETVEPNDQGTGWLMLVVLAIYALWMPAMHLLDWLGRQHR